MAIAQRKPLKIHPAWSETHPNELCKHELRSKAEVEAYFNGTFGAGTVNFAGTEGTDYEFDATKGFRTITNTGAMRIFVQNIITDAVMREAFVRNYSFDMQLFRDEWIEPDYTGLTPTIPELNGTAWAGSGFANLFSLFTNTNNGGQVVILRNDTTIMLARGRNRLFIAAGGQASANAATYARPLSNYRHDEFMDFRYTATGGCAQGWIDHVPFVPPHGGANGATTGERYCYNASTSDDLRPHTTGDLYITLGNHRNGGGTTGCPRWIRNFRLYNAPTIPPIHPYLREVHSFGDSYAATAFGPTAAAADNMVGAAGHPGSLQTGISFADINATLQFYKAMAENGYHVGGMYGGGAGGHNFESTLISAGYVDQFKRTCPTMVFTFGMHNDVTRVAGGHITISALETLLLGTYMLPMFQRGCKLWGWVIPGISGDLQDAGQNTAFNQIADMLLGLPAAWDAYCTANGYAYQGMVKVRDVRATMSGSDLTQYAITKYWQHYHNPAENVHPGDYGSALFADKCAEMALERLRGN